MHVQFNKSSVFFKAAWYLGTGWSLDLERHWLFRILLNAIKKFHVRLSSELSISPSVRIALMPRNSIVGSCEVLSAVNASARHSYTPVPTV